MGPNAGVNGSRQPADWLVRETKRPTPAPKRIHMLSHGRVDLTHKVMGAVLMLSTPLGWKELATLGLVLKGDWFLPR